MAKSSLNARDFIQQSFSPFVAVLSNPAVEEICQKNHLSFIELLEPFCTVTKDVYYKDPSGNVITIKNPRAVFCDVNSKPLEAAVARRLLNESVSLAADKNVDIVTFKSGNIIVDIPETVPWFENWKTTFLKVQFPSDHEFTKHYLACMIVISSQDENPMDTLSNKVQQLQQLLNMSPPKTMPKWFCSSILRYYVLLHDTIAGDLIKAEKVFEEMKATYSANHCYMLQINSQTKAKIENEFVSYWSKFNVERTNSFDFENSTSMTDSVMSLTGESAKIEMGQEVFEQSKSDVLIHPLSPQIESHYLLNSKEMNGIDDNDSYQNTEVCLTAEDVDRLKSLVSNFVVNALIPFAETQMQYLNEMVFNKKNVSKSLFSVPRRWFGSPKPGSPVSVPNAHYYHPDSPELQMRKLADLCFMFGAYNSAFQAYHSVKKDFNNDGAWPHYAGALEMAALSAFLVGQDVKKAQEYTEESVVTYLHTCRMPQFATRVTLCATECLKSLNMFGEAAGRLLMMTSEDSDLRSALLLEEASYCFIKSRKPVMPRKYAFHLVLAGHRFMKANQKKHSLRCYRQAYQVYRDKNWGLAEDHIHFTIGKLASSLKQKQVTVEEFSKLFTKPSTQLPSQQMIYLKEYFLALNELQKDSKDSAPFLEIPHVNHSSIQVVLNTQENEQPIDGCILAGRHMSEEELSDTRWWKLEENLVSYSNNAPVSMFFKPSVGIFSSNINNSVKPVCVVDEQIRTSVDLVNPLNIPLLLNRMKLTWTHSMNDDNPYEHDISDIFVDTEILESLSLAPNSVSKVSLHLTPKIAGELRITGIKFTIVLQPINEGAECLSITGRTIFNPERTKLVSQSKEQPDYRLQLAAVNNAARLKIYFKNLPTEMLCGEVREISVRLLNVGTLPIKSVLFSSSESNSFAVANGSVKNNVFPLSQDTIQPGHSVVVTIFLRGCNKSGRVSIDLLFYYDTEKTSQQKVKYRLVYHTLHLLVHESVFSSATVSRSVKLGDDNVENINIRLQMQNKNQVYDSVNFLLHLRQLSLCSAHWQLYDVISTSKRTVVSLEQEQVTYLTLKAKRVKNCDRYSDVVLGSTENTVSSTGKPYDDFTQSVIHKTFKKSFEMNEKCPESAITLNSLLILYWKAELKNVNELVQIVGQHHLPLLKLGQRYSTAETYEVSEVRKPAIAPSGIFIPSSISNLFEYDDKASKELVLVKMKHPSFVTHSFTSNRICSVDVEVVIQNCSDDSVEVKLDATYQTNNNVSKINEYATFLWTGVVMNTFTLKEHSCTIIPLSVCVGNSGTYDLTSQFNVSARKTCEDVFISQSLISPSQLCVSNDIL